MASHAGQAAEEAIARCGGVAHSVIPWGFVFWQFFRTQLFDPKDVYLMAGDQCGVTQSGRGTHGLDRFFSSL